MANPFSYTKIISGSAFCNRTEELKALAQYVEDGQNLLLYSDRRLGKTSLLYRLKEKLQPKTKVLYVNLFGTINEQNFISGILDNLSSIESSFDKITGLVKKVFLSSGVEFHFDPFQGTTTLKPKFDLSNNLASLDKVFALLSSLSGNKKLLVILDEFQEIENYPEAGFIKNLRRIIETQKTVSYVFSGSRKSILLKMFSKDSKAFYNQAQNFLLKKIDSKHYKTWIKKNFRGHRFTLSDDFLEEVITLLENHPMVIQRFFYHLWQEEKLDESTIDKILHILFERHEGELMETMNPLTLNQKKALMAACRTGGKNLYASTTLKSVELRTNAQMKKALEALETKEIITKNGHFYLQNVLLKLWVIKGFPK